MITQKNINWYLEDPTRLQLKKPFTRGGDLESNSTSEDIQLTSKAIPSQSSLS